MQRILEQTGANPQQRPSPSFGVRALIVAVLTLFFGTVIGLAPAHAHGEGARQISGEFVEQSFQPNASFSNVERLDRAGRIAAGHTVSAHIFDAGCPEACTAGCCCGGLCSTILSGSAQSSLPVYELHRRLIPLHQPAHDSVAAGRMHRPPKA
jgi:hypothetical protein